MITRIRYKKTNENTLTSNDILCNNEFVKLELNLMDLSYSVTSSSNGLLKTGNAENLSSLKRKAKLVAKELGANFRDEIRGKNKRLNLNEQA